MSLLTSKSLFANALRHILVGLGIQLALWPPPGFIAEHPGVVSWAGVKVCLAELKGEHRGNHKAQT